MFPDEGKPNEKIVASDLMDKFFIYCTDVRLFTLNQRFLEVS